jgi:hypothetical protein
MHVRRKLDAAISVDPVLYLRKKLDSGKFLFSLEIPSWIEQRKPCSNSLTDTAHSSPVLAGYSDSLHSTIHTSYTC